MIIVETRVGTTLHACPVEDCGRWMASDSLLCEQCRDELRTLNPSGIEGRTSIEDISATLFDLDAQLADDREMVAGFGTQVRPDFW